MSFADQFTSLPLASLDLDPVQRVAASTSVAATVAAMNEAGSACALVEEGGRDIGIFTSRDVLLSVADRPETWDGPIAAVMTPTPKSIGGSESPLAALQMMNEYRLRHLPVVGDDGSAIGTLTHSALLGLAASLLRADVAASGAPGAEHELLFVDFRGMHPAKPVTSPLDTSVGSAIHQMRVRGIGSLMLVDRRGALAGLLTDRDLLEKVACRVADLQAAKAASFMTAAPITLAPRDPIAAGVHAMAENGFSHLPLVGATGRPVGMVSFRDLADYLETILETEAPALT